MIFNKNKLSIYLTFTIVIFIFFSSIKLKANEAFYAKEHIIHDLKLDLLWLRCSVGQFWNPKTNNCDGKAVKLKMSQIKDVITQANEQLGGSWRLPTRKELENLVCMSCDKVKINNKFFPGTPYEPFWTGEKNNWSKTKGFYWSVNFFTGHTFGRFPGNIPNFVRLVRSR